MISSPLMNESYDPLLKDYTDQMDRELLQHGIDDLESRWFAS